jgi:hypothetical protein
MDGFHRKKTLCVLYTKGLLLYETMVRANANHFFECAGDTYALMVREVSAMLYH